MHIAKPLIFVNIFYRYSEYLFVVFHIYKTLRWTKKL